MLNLTRRLEARPKASPELADDRAEILRRATAPAAGIRPPDATVPMSRGISRTKTKTGLKPRSPRRGIEQKETKGTKGESIAPSGG